MSLTGVHNKGHGSDTKCEPVTADIIDVLVGDTLEQGFSTSALLAFEASYVFVVEDKPIRYRMLAASLVSIHKGPVERPSSSCENQRYLQTLPNIP